MKIIVFTSCAPIKGGRGEIQKLALQTWKQTFGCDIIILGNDEGVSDLCKENKYIHIPDVVTGREYGIENSVGVMFDDSIHKIRSLYPAEWYMYINSDNLAVSTSMFRQYLYHFMKLKNVPAFYTYRYNVNRSDVFLDGTWKQEDLMLKLNKPGIDSYLWPKEIFYNIELLPLVSDGWSVDVWMAQATREIADTYLGNNLWQTIHPSHPESSCHQEQEHRNSTIHNKRIIKEWRNIDINRLYENKPPEWMVV
jgi:hypothetical protein